MQTQALATESDGRTSGTPVDWPNGESQSQSLGSWRTDALLGCGGTAEVWHAVAPDGREAALKLPKREWRRHAGGECTTAPRARRVEDGREPARRHAVRARRARRRRGGPRARVLAARGSRSIARRAAAAMVAGISLRRRRALRSRASWSRARRCEAEERSVRRRRQRAAHRSDVPRAPSMHPLS